MPARLLYLLLLFAAFCGRAATNAGPVNLDFEGGSPGAVPPGWSSPTLRLGYAAELTTEAPKQGKQCVRVSGKPQAMERGGPSFGNVMQQIDAAPYRGKRVRFRGAVRVSFGNARAALWMRVDRPGGQMGFFDNMQDRPVRSSEWAYYEITGDIDADAQVLNVGMMLQGEGTAWLDDVTIEATNRPPPRAAAARAVTPRGLENLIAFTRLYGVVRHFHASDEAAAADWNAVAVNGAERAEGARDAAELAARLEEIFLPLAPTARIYLTGQPVPNEKPPAAQALLMWEHHGLGGSGDARTMYRSERVRRGAGTTAPPPFQANLGGGVSVTVPLAVHADDKGTLPRAARKPPAPPAADYTGNDRATRIGAVVILWNVLQHFYPYFDVVDVDWPAELKTALRAAGTDRGEAAFLRTLRRMVAAIDDGHGSVTHPSSSRRGSLPILWRVIGDALIVTTVDTGVSGVAPGDEVVAIDGKPAVAALAEIEQLISGTPQWRRAVALRELTLGEAKAALTIRNADGSTRTVTLARASRPEPLREKRPEKIAKLTAGIWYVDLDRVTDADFENALDQLATASGIIFDLRGYPRTGTLPLRHLIGSVTESARWNIPILRRPDREGVEWDTRGRWQLQPRQPRLTPNIAFLTDGRAISYAESWLGIVEHYKLAAIVGETTAGTNGNINTVTLPGGYRAVFTGMKVLKHDGSKHHGIGVEPTVRVSPTLAGIRAGRDEQLERAIEVLGRRER